MIGIYKITNTTNGQVYIGQSTNIEKRWKEHIRHSKKEKKLKTYIHKAIEKYGKENFNFEVLEECSSNELDQKEIEYIAIYHSNIKGIGYNLTLGADSKTMMYGENNPKSVLNNNEVEFIRKLYANKDTSCMEVYDLFIKTIKTINLNTFKSIWNGHAYKNVMPEVLTLENKEINKKLSFEHKNKNAHCHSDIKNFVLDIRKRKLNGEKRKDVYKDYTQFNINTFYDVWKGNTFKYIQP